MNNIIDFDFQSELAFASYANLSIGRPDVRSLADADMSTVQATKFAAEWRVLDQENLSNGLSATVFQRVAGGPSYLAIRGTEKGRESLLDLNADYILALGFPPQLNGQYISLSAKVQQWLANGTLTPGFTVTGHSLGGYLAGAIGIAFQSEVSAVYSYNAPGIGGALIGGAYQALKQALGLGSLSILPTSYNLRGSRGLSLIAGLGAQLSPPIGVEIEGAPGFGLDNHAISRISDSLAVFALLGQFNSAYDMDQIARIVSASSNRDADTLENAVNPLAKALGLPAIPVDDRNALFSTIVDLQGLATSSQAHAEIRAFPGQSVSSLLANALSSDGVSYRAALVGLDPYAVVGSASYTQRISADTELGLYEPISGNGLSDQYLADRAAMLVWKIQDYISDSSRVLPGNRPETYKYIDKTLKDSTGNDLTFTVRGRQLGSVGNPVFVTFGSTASETLTGGNLAIGDHLYGRWRKRHSRWTRG